MKINMNLLILILLFTTMLLPRRPSSTTFSRVLFSFSVEGEGDVVVGEEVPGFL
jgi:hypothetical protein